MMIKPQMEGGGSGEIFKEFSIRKPTQNVPKLNPNHDPKSSQIDGNKWKFIEIISQMDPTTAPQAAPPDSRADSPQTAPRQPAKRPFTKTPS